jgi:long-chain acyl-CoA synthetase
VNTGDLLRFEIEGQSIHLPPHKRVLGYEISFEPLPRTTTGKLKRHEIARRVRQKQHTADRLREQANVHDWSGDAHAKAVADILARRTHASAIVPEANLELDLSLDSMERVELIAELEQRFGVRVDEGQAHDLLTVQQLIDAVRPASDARGDGGAEDSWSVLLNDLPPPGDPLVARLHRPRLLMPLVFYSVLRLVRLVMPTIAVSGREQLPRSGPYIISPNHQSYLDPFFVCSVLPFHVFRQLFFVGAAEYFETPLTAWAATQLNLVPVDPDANLIPAMKAGASGLKLGKILVLFPEGERSIDGTVKRFKKGAPILSRHLHVPVVPVSIRGVFELWPRNRPFNWRLLIPGSGHRVHVSFGAPLMVGEDVTYAEGATQLRQRVMALWEVRSH